MIEYRKVHFSDGSAPKILEVRDGNMMRFVDDNHGRYLVWLSEGNTPAPISGDRFVSIVDGQPVVDPNKQATLTAEKWKEVRADRNARVSAADWTQIEDAPFNTTKKQAWRAYRQALRDLPQTQTDPFNIVWPTPPEVQ